MHVERKVMSSKSRMSDFWKGVGSGVMSEVECWRLDEDDETERCAYIVVLRCDDNNPMIRNLLQKI